MHSDPDPDPVLPEDAGPASVGRVLAAYALAVLLFSVTLGAGYLILLSGMSEVSVGDVFAETVVLRDRERGHG